jgi:hypothetical protein
MTARTPEAIENHKRIDRERKAQLAKEHWRNQTPEQRENNRAMRQQNREFKKAMAYSGPGIHELPEPVSVNCRCCGAELTLTRLGNFCDWVCAANYQLASKRKPLPEPFIYARVSRRSH